MVSKIRNFVKLILFLGILYLVLDVLEYELKEKTTAPLTNNNLNTLKDNIELSQQQLQTKIDISSTKILELENKLKNVPILSVENKLNNAPILSVDRSLCSLNGESMIGNMHHGGWFICKDFLPTHNDNNFRHNNDTIEQCIIYSFGLGADWSFDSNLEKNGCEVHGFDPSGLNWREGMHGAAYSNFNYKKDYPSPLGSVSKTGSRIFHNWGLGAADIALYPSGTIPQEWPGLGDPQLSQSNNEPWEIKSIQRTINDLNHNNKIISILKIDTEGSEWDALASFFNSKVAEEYILSGHIKQLLIEWHWDPDSKSRNERHNQILKRTNELGFKQWKIERHDGSDCCLDVSYIWQKP